MSSSIRDHSKSYPSLGLNLIFNWQHGGSMKYDCENLTFAFVGLAIAFLLSTLASISFQSPPRPVAPVAPVGIERDTRDMVIVYRGFDYVGASLDGDVCVGSLHYGEGSCQRAIPEPTIP